MQTRLPVSSPSCISQLIPAKAHNSFPQRMLIGPVMKTIRGWELFKMEARPKILCFTFIPASPAAFARFACCLSLTPPRITCPTLSRLWLALTFQPAVNSSAPDASCFLSFRYRSKGSEDWSQTRPRARIPCQLKNIWWVCVCICFPFYWFPIWNSYSPMSSGAHLLLATVKLNISFILLETRASGVCSSQRGKPFAGNQPQLSEWISEISVRLPPLFF